VPRLLVHGGGSGRLASFDQPVPSYSLAANLAVAGHAVYVMDVRGWGASTRPPALDQPAATNPPAVGSDHSGPSHGCHSELAGEESRRPGQA